MLCTFVKGKYDERCVMLYIYFKKREQIVIFWTKTPLQNKAYRTFKKHNWLLFIIKYEPPRRHHI